MNTLNPPSHPSLPRIFSLPFSIIPGQLQYRAITRALNTLFAEALTEGELDFVIDKTINISIEDAGLHFSVRYRDGALLAGSLADRPDLRISGDSYAFLLLGTRKEDADTLFFQQQIKSQGDTELGLFVKNFLDGIDLDTLPAHKVLDTLMRRALWLAERTAKTPLRS